MYKSPAEELFDVILQAALDLYDGRHDHDHPPAAHIPAAPTGRGPRQRQILAIPELVDEEGLSVLTIAQRIGYDTPNTYGAISNLAGAGFLEHYKDSQRTYWRLARHYRAAAGPITLLASLLGPDEWVLDADVSLALREDLAATPLVAVIAGRPGFAYPGRIRSAPPVAATRVPWDQIKIRHRLKAMG